MNNSINYMRILLYVCVVILSFSSISCRKKCKNTAVTEYKFTQQEKDFIPYTSKDTVKFTNAIGDTAVFVSKGRGIYVYEWNNGYEDCPDFFTAEYDTVHLHNIRGANYDIKLELAKFSETSSHFYINMGNEGYSVGFFTRNPPKFDSLDFNEVTYYSVYHAIGISTKEIYYNQEYGILEYTLSTGESWTISQ